MTSTLRRSITGRRHFKTNTLREFIIKGFVMDHERMKQGKLALGKDDFDELLDHIRKIRASERRFYQKITEIYALAVDYSADFSGPWDGERTGGKAQSRGRIRCLSPAAGHGIHIGF